MSPDEEDRIFPGIPFAATVNGISLGANYGYTTPPLPVFTLLNEVPMIRRLTLAAFLLVACALSATAQRHAGNHSDQRPHGPNHVPMDSATAAALHLLLHGTWEGATKSHAGAAAAMKLSAVTDSTRQVVVTMQLANAGAPGKASNFLVDGRSLRWTQTVGDKACQAAATLPAPKTAKPVLTGQLTCGTEAMTFSLVRTAE